MPARAAGGRKILADAIAAAGGQKAVDAIQHVTSRGSITATVAGTDVAGTVTMSEDRDGSSRDEMDIGGMSMLTVVGPTGGCSAGGGGVPQACRAGPPPCRGRGRGFARPRVVGTPAGRGARRRG